DIVYGTNNEFGFDYLRDNMVKTKERMVQRKLKFAIIDEVDSILIDEARTPLIISGQGAKSSDHYITANRFVKTLQGSIEVEGDTEQKGDYSIDEKDKAIRLSDSGIAKAENFYRVENLSDIENMELQHHINQALKANYLMKRDRDYVVNDKEIIIVDEFTGRLMIGRRYSEGLHQAIEAKENVLIRNESKTYATITFQNYFRLYRKLSGMTGTAKTEEEEFRGIYGLDVIIIPTNLPNIRVDHIDQLYKSKEGKITAIIKDIEERHASGQPVLVGTVSVEKSEELSLRLRRQRIPHNVLNAKNHEQEAEIIAQAGKRGMVTIATNMAGRGTDIMLGGNPEHLSKKKLESLGFSHELILEATSYASNVSEEGLKARKEYEKHYAAFKIDTEKEKNQILALGGLHIIGTERHESRRIDNQLRGRAGRQGDPGSSIFYLSMEDDLVRIFGGERMLSIANTFNLPDDAPIAVRILTNQIEKAQLKIEDKNYSIRKHVLAYDDVMNRQREIIYAERQKVLTGQDIHDEIIKMLPAVVAEVVQDNVDFNIDYFEWDYGKINANIENKLLPSGSNVVDKKLAEELKIDSIIDAVLERTEKAYQEKSARYTELGINFGDVERQIMLSVVDSKWIDHIDAMDALRKGIGLRAYGQRDPVQSYQQEGFEMFDKMVENIQREIVLLALKGEFVLSGNENKPKISNAKLEENQYPEHLVTNEHGSAVNKNKNVGRNDPCPCGSGKKFKNCCGMRG
ncbi:MAG: preprotein translocase subunit SecA, partial [Bacteroidia bacterium]|nr:preprotein translocase subunit SecA [Bacteroidia bacterium]